MHYLDYNEKRCHGTADFPIEYYYVDSRHPRYQMPFHWHKEYEIIRIKEGNFHLFLEKEELRAGTGDVIFIPEGIVHGGTPEECVYECVVFDLKALLSATETLRRYIRQITEGQVSVRCHYTKEDAKVCRSVRRLFHALSRQEAGFELSTVGALYTFLGLIFQFEYYSRKPAAAHTLTAAPVRHREKTEAIRPVLTYIETSYPAPISLNRLAELAGMSPKYFCRYFRSITHQSPIEYVNYYRVERACCFLSATDLSVTEIGYSCGFHDTAYFIRVFKRLKNVTPRQYRKHTADIGIIP